MQTTADNSPIWIAAIAERTEHTVNSKTTALEVKIEALKELGASKDATITAQKEPQFLPLDARQ